MAILVRNITLNLEDNEELAYEKAGKILGVAVDKFYIAKKAVDARKKNAIKLIYTVGVQLQQPNQEIALVEKLALADVLLYNYAPLQPQPGTKPMAHRPVIVGFGPSGMFAGLLLARNGYRPIILERGAPVAQRAQDVSQFWQTGKLNPVSNVQFGAGGAGTFSDGKLTTRIGDPLCDEILQEFVHFGAPQDILYKAKPHIGTDYLRTVVQAMGDEIIALGGEIRFHCQMTGISMQNGAVCSVSTPEGDIQTNLLVLAIGHSARDTFEMLLESEVTLQQKPFSVGLRIEHLQTNIDAGLYGEFAGHKNLPVAAYQLSHRQDQRGIYSFCMCPGGTVVPAASSQGHLVVNGMSEYARSGPNANSAIVVAVDHQDFGTDILAGMRYQQQLERAAFVMGGSGYKAPVQTVGRFLAGQGGCVYGTVQPSYAIGVQEADFSKLFTPKVYSLLQLGLRRFDSKLTGFAAPDAVLTGVETRTSSPIRILRNFESMEAPGAAGVYPCGEGAGYAGGIISAAVDGLRAALKIIEIYSPLA